ncbi:MAG: septal ring lytic transglycosylase RlpA family protein [Methylophilaceae bacterium]
MKNFTSKNSAVVLSIALLTACAGVANKPEVKIPAPPTTQSPDNTGTKPGGYYLDDGPGDDVPAGIDNIPDAQPKIETPLERANKPYSALGNQYTPLTSYQPYNKQGVASWYGKRYHGKQTSSGEVYDMYSMSAAHTTLPIPSYAKVTNPANGRSVIVRINDRGPFKHDRLIDLSYAAAYKLRLANQGSALVNVEMIDTRSNESIAKAIGKPAVKVETVAAVESKPVKIVAPVIASPVIEDTTAATSPVELEPVIRSEPAAKPLPPVGNPVSNKPETATSKTKTAEPITPIINTAPAIKKANSGALQYFVQAGAFKSEANSQALQKKIQGLAVAENIGLDSVYNDGLYRVKLGPFASKKEADAAASSIRKQLGITAIIKN